MGKSIGYKEDWNLRTPLPGALLSHQWEARSPTEKGAGLCLWCLRDRQKFGTMGGGTEIGGPAGPIIETIRWTSEPRFGPAPGCTSVESSSAAWGGEALL